MGGGWSTSIKQPLCPIYFLIEYTGNRETLSDPMRLRNAVGSRRPRWSCQEGKEPDGHLDTGGSCFLGHTLQTVSAANPRKPQNQRYQVPLPHGAAQGATHSSLLPASSWPRLCFCMASWPTVSRKGRNHSQMTGMQQLTLYHLKVDFRKLTIPPNLSMRKRCLPAQSGVDFHEEPCKGKYVLA